MECMVCSESLGTCLNCCPGKIVCSGCLNEKLPVVCPNCGIQSIPEQTNLVSKYLSGISTSLLNKIQKLIQSYDQTIQTQAGILQYNLNLIQKHPEAHRVGNFKDLELTLDQNRCLKSQLESMISVLTLNPNLNLLESYLKIENRISDWPGPIESPLGRIFFYESNLISNSQWLSYLIPGNYLDRHLSSKDTPVRTLTFHEKLEPGSRNRYWLKEVAPDYYYIMIRYSEGIVIYDPQTFRTLIKFKAETEIYNAKWIAFQVEGYLWVKSLTEESPEVKINVHPIDDFYIFRDYLIILSGGNVFRMSFYDPNSFYGMATQVSELINFNIAIQKDRTLIEFDIPTGKIISSLPIGNAVARFITPGIVLLDNKRIYQDGMIYDAPPGYKEFPDYMNITISTGEFYRSVYKSGTYTFSFY